MCHQLHDTLYISLYTVVGPIITRDRALCEAIIIICQLAARGDFPRKRQLRRAKIFVRDAAEKKEEGTNTAMQRSVAGSLVENCVRVRRARATTFLFAVLSAILMYLLILTACPGTLQLRPSRPSKNFPRLAPVSPEIKPRTHRRLLIFLHSCLPLNIVEKLYNCRVIRQILFQNVALLAKAVLLRTPVRHHSSQTLSNCLSINFGRRWKV